jgi:hypothetical protein
VWGRRDSSEFRGRGARPRRHAATYKAHMPTYSRPFAPRRCRVGASEADSGCGCGRTLALLLPARETVAAARGCVPTVSRKLSLRRAGACPRLALVGDGLVAGTDVMAYIYIYALMHMAPFLFLYRTSCLSLRPRARASEGVPALSASARRRRPGQRNGRAGQPRLTDSHSSSLRRLACCTALPYICRGHCCSGTTLHVALRSGARTGPLSAAWEQYRTDNCSVDSGACWFYGFHDPCARRDFRSGRT